MLVPMRAPWEILECRFVPQLRRHFVAGQGLQGGGELMLTVILFIVVAAFAVYICLRERVF